MVETHAVGAIRVQQKGKDEYWISPMFILPTYQGLGLAQEVLKKIEFIYPGVRKWSLVTILEEKRNTHLYEKMGYVRTGTEKPLNERATLVYYEKVL